MLTRLFFWKIGNEQKEIFTSNACIDSLLSRLVSAKMVKIHSMGFHNGMKNELSKL